MNVKDVALKALRKRTEYDLVAAFVSLNTLSKVTKFEFCKAAGITRPTFDKYYEEHIDVVLKTYREAGSGL